MPGQPVNNNVDKSILTTCIIKILSLYNQNTFIVEEFSNLTIFDPNISLDSFWKG